MWTNRLSGNGCRTRFGIPAFWFIETPAAILRLGGFSMHPIYASWCHPRSMSAAMESVMRERGDLRIVHEPLISAYYFGDTDRSLQHFEPNADHPQTCAYNRRFISEQATLGSGPDADAAPGINAAPIDAGAGTVLSGSGIVVAHAQESVLGVRGPSRKAPVRTPLENRNEDRPFGHVGA